MVTNVNNSAIMKGLLDKYLKSPTTSTQLTCVCVGEKEATVTWTRNSGAVTGIVMRVCSMYIKVQSQVS